jgi:DHA1 family bicyclomycin/chloramphenicol resistance-like MFS transporter
LPNCTALALSNHASRAGVASSVIGAAQFALAAVVMTLLGGLHDGSALPMVLVIAACAVAALQCVVLST